MAQPSSPADSHAHPAEGEDEDGEDVHQRQEGEEEDFVSSPPSASPSLPVLGYRHVFALLGFLGFLFVYALRICVSVTVVLMAVEFGWSDGDRGLVLSSFFWGYVVLQIPGGTASEKAGGKWIYGGGIFGTCVFTLLTPVSAKYGFGALIFVRALTGLCEGVTFPSMHAMLSRWAPPAERTSLGGIIYCGASMGTVIAMPLTAMLCDVYGWESVFYLYGGAGFVWCALWGIFVSSSPAESRFMGEREKDAIARALGGHVTIRRPPVPYRAIFTSVPFYAIMFTHIAKNYGDYTLLTELPTYMREVLHYPLREDGFLSSLPFLIGFVVGVGSGFLADYLRRGFFSTTATRKIFNTAGYFGQALAMALVGFAGEDKTVCVALLCTAVGIGGLTNAGVSVNHIDIAPNFAGTLLGFTNMAANFCGIIAPYVAGTITNHHPDSAHWKTVFLIAALILAVGGSIFLTLASGEEQPFNETGRRPEPLLLSEDDRPETEEESHPPANPVV